jgi:hypothetical protein
MSNSGVLGPVCCLGAVERVDVATALSGYLHGRMQKYIVLSRQARDMVDAVVPG